MPATEPVAELCALLAAAFEAALKPAQATGDGLGLFGVEGLGVGIRNLGFRLGFSGF